MLRLQLLQKMKSWKMCQNMVIDLALVSSVSIGARSKLPLVKLLPNKEYDTRASFPGVSCVHGHAQADVWSEMAWLLSEVWNRSETGTFDTCSGTQRETLPVWNTRQWFTFENTKLRPVSFWRIFTALRQRTVENYQDVFKLKLIHWRFSHQI